MRGPLPRHFSDLAMAERFHVDLTERVSNHDSLANRVTASSSQRNAARCAAYLDAPSITFLSNGSAVVGASTVSATGAWQAEVVKLVP
ncbi:MAG: hypothetical protein EOO73_14265 [Myxococcales bacterium]|nr:MAG: hypothetical protein EOO73_14265 [Myxococcales bacterium]